MKIRHYWIHKEHKCDCGCKDRVYINNFYCAEKLKEILAEQGFDLTKKCICGVDVKTNSNGFCSFECEAKSKLKNGGV